MCTKSPMQYSKDQLSEKPSSAPVSSRSIANSYRRILDVEDHQGRTDVQVKAQWTVRLCMFGRQCERAKREHSEEECEHAYF